MERTCLQNELNWKNYYSTGTFHRHLGFFATNFFHAKYYLLKKWRLNFQVLRNDVKTEEMTIYSQSYHGLLVQIHVVINSFSQQSVTFYVLQKLSCESSYKSK